ncbi:MAG TPA: hypothetical protein VM580_25290, partial [Labilithrix sp.]|nr:hypothetical protein [Labilithrix sp.]
MSTWLGIDIGTEAVKVVAVRSSYRKLQLLGMASAEVAQAGSLAEAITMAVRAVMGDTRGLGDGIAIAVAEPTS